MEPRKPHVKGKSAVKPLANLRSARRNIALMPEFCDTPEKRFQALTGLLNRAFKAERPNPRVIALIENERAKIAPRVTKLARKRSRRFCFTNNPVGRHLDKVDKRIRLDMLNGFYGSVSGALISLEAYAKRGRCEEYVASYLENAAKLLHENFKKRSGGKARDQIYELFFDSLDAAVRLYREAGKHKEVQRVDNYANRMAQTL